MSEEVPVGRLVLGDRVGGRRAAAFAGWARGAGRRGAAMRAWSTTLTHIIETVLGVFVG